MSVSFASTAEKLELEPAAEPPVLHAVPDGQPPAAGPTYPVGEVPVGLLVFRGNNVIETDQEVTALTPRASFLLDCLRSVHRLDPLSRSEIFAKGFAAEVAVDSTREGQFSRAKNELIEVVYGPDKTSIIPDPGSRGNAKYAIDSRLELVDDPAEIEPKPAVKVKAKPAPMNLKAVVENVAQPRVKSMPRPKAKTDSAPNEDNVHMYLTEIGQYQLLKKEDEIRLAKKIEAGLVAEQRLQETGLSANDKRQLRRQVRDGDRAKNEFIKSNLRLVVATAKKYQNAIELLDAIQFGNLGLIHAVEKFDWRKGFKFSTYGTWWIKQAITRGIANTSRSIRLPVHAHDIAYKAFSAELELEQLLGRSPTVKELADKTGLSVSKIRDIYDYIKSPESLNQTFGENDELERGDRIEDRQSRAPDIEAEASLLPDALKEALSHLPPRLAQVVELRFGLDGVTGRSLQDVGDVLGVTRETARKLESQAFARLRHPAASHGLKDYLMDI